MGGRKSTIRKLRQSFCRPAYADVPFDLVVVGFKFLVVDRPVLTITVACGCLEFEVTISIAYARPAEGLAAHLPSANPHERLVIGKGVRKFPVVDEKLMTIFVAGVAEPLYGLIPQECLLISEAAVTHAVRPDMLSEIAGGTPWRSGFEDQHFHALLCEGLSDPAAAGAGTYYECVVELRFGHCSTDSQKVAARDHVTRRATPQ